jgi:hypothetical protein
MSTVAAPPADCANCGAALSGRFCSACGQKASSPNVNLHDFFHEAFHEFSHVDGKIIRTVRLLLTRPGELTREFLMGRRERYVSPLRLYLTCSLIFFALAAVAPKADHPVFTVTGGLKGEATMSPERARELHEEATARGNEALIHQLPKVMFVLMPVFGLLTWVFYRKAQPFYAAHLYYSIHYHAYTFLVLTAAIALRPILGAIAGTALPMTIIGTWHFKSLRRVFGGSGWSLFWKGSLIWWPYFAMVFGAIVGVAFWSIRDLMG